MIVVLRNTFLLEVGLTFGTTCKYLGSVHHGCINLVVHFGHVSKLHQSVSSQCLVARTLPKPLVALILAFERHQLLVTLGIQRRCCLQQRFNLWGSSLPL